MGKYKNKIIAGVIIAAVLAFAFLWGGNAPGIRNAKPEKTGNADMNSVQTEEKADIKDSPKVENQAETEQVPDDISERQAEETSSHNADHMPMTAKKVDSEENAPSRPQSSSADYTKESKTEENGHAEKDKHQPEPAAENKPAPIEPESAVISDKEFTCTLSVRCDTILKNPSWLDKEKLDLVPKDGVIYAEQTVTFYEGESVFNILLREMKRNKIHMEFENTPIYNSAYIEGIGNLYEFDCGELSGWMYKVNGWFPNYGCSRYQLKEGDKVEWVYTCDLGADVGGSYGARNGR